MSVFDIPLPLSPTARELTWRAVSVVSVAASPMTGKQQVYSHPGQWWEVVIDLPPMSAGDAATWAGALLRLNGREGTFLFRPTDKTPRESLSGTIVVDAIDGYEIDLAGMTGTLSAGDWIQIEGGLYRVTVGATAVSGDATVSVWPQPRAGVQAGVSVVNFATPAGRFRLFDSFDWDMDVAMTYGISFGGREVV